MYRNLVLQGFDTKFNKNTVRCIFFGWIFFCVIIYALYSGNLIAALASPSYEPPIDTLVDVARACKEQNLKLIMARSTALSRFFLSSTYGVHHEVAQYYDDALSALPYAQRYKKVIDGVAICFTGYISSMSNQLRYGQHKFHAGKEFFFQQMYAPTLPKGAPYLQPLSEAMQRIHEAGLPHLWLRRQQWHVLKINGNPPEERVYTSKRPRQGNTPINITQMQFAFIVLMTGLMICSVSFAAEILYFTLNKDM